MNSYGSYKVGLMMRDDKIHGYGLESYYQKSDLGVFVNGSFTGAKSEITDFNTKTYRSRNRDLQSYMIKHGD